MPKTRSRGGYGLKDSPLFRLRSRRKLAKILRVSPKLLADISSSENIYTRRWKHKNLDRWLKVEPRGENEKDYRQIDIPDPRLKAIQARIAALLGRVAPPGFLFSPVKGRSYVDNAAHHLGSNAFWLLDVADYFPSCTANNVAHFFMHDLECSPDVTAVLVRISTLGGCLPQGSPCSPILAYFSNLQMWNEIAQVVQGAGCKISIYADDITISGSIIRKSMIWNVKKIVHRHGLRLKPSKEVSLISAPADITGVIVKDVRTLIPNRQLKKLAELRAARLQTKNLKERKKLDTQIAGTKTQRLQVERNAGYVGRAS